MRVGVSDPHGFPQPLLLPTHSATMDQTKFIKVSGYLTHNNPLSGSHHAGVPPTELNLPVIPTSAYADALKKYEDLDETDDEGDFLG